MHLLDVRDILQKAGRKTKEIGQMDLVIADDDFEIIGPVSFELMVTNLEELILVEGELKARIKSLCSRCNQQFSMDISAEVEVEYYEEDKLFSFGPADKKLGKEDLLFVVDSKGSIDLEEAIRQSLISSLPLDFKCKNCDKRVSYSV